MNPLQLGIELGVIYAVVILIILGTLIPIFFGVFLGMTFVRHWLVFGGGPHKAWSRTRKSLRPE